MEEQSVGPYRLINRLGVGGFANVFLAEHRYTGARVALKMLQQVETEALPAVDPERSSRFLAEARLLAHIQDPRIVKVLDAGFSRDGTPYIATEFISGRTLAEVMRQQAPLPEPFVRRLGAEVAHAMSVVHRYGIVHQDIKPHNVVLVEPAGATDAPWFKIVDFGIAGQPGQRLPRDLVAGTPAYMAPELFEGSSPTLQSDIYSMGVMLHEMATGRLPFLSSDIQGMVRDKLTLDPVTPLEWHSALSGTMATIILRCLARDPRLRFSSMDALAGALEGNPDALLPGDYRGAPDTQSQRELFGAIQVRIDTLETAQWSTESRLRTELEGLLSQLQRLHSDVLRQRDELRSSSEAVYSYVWLASVGANIQDAKIVRHVPVRIYVSDPVPDASHLQSLMAAVELAFAEGGFEKALDLPEESGSWFKRLFARTKDAASHEDVRRRLEKIERAAEVAILDKPQAEANKHQAEATSALISALKDTSSACVQVGSLLVVKCAGPDGKPAIVARTLTPAELKRLEQDQTILANPQMVLQVLAQGSTKRREPSLFDDIDGMKQLSDEFRRTRPTPALLTLSTDQDDVGTDDPPAGGRGPR